MLFCSSCYPQARDLLSLVGGAWLMDWIRRRVIMRRKGGSSLLLQGSPSSVMAGRRHVAECCTMYNLQLISQIITVEEFGFGDYRGDGEVEQHLKLEHRAQSAAAASIRHQPFQRSRRAVCRWRGRRR